MDFTHKEQLVKLPALRVFPYRENQDHFLALAHYVTRMAASKLTDHLIGPNRAAIESGPDWKAFKARNLEVLFCYEPVDEYAMGNVREFDGNKLTGAYYADVKLSALTLTRGRPQRKRVKDLAQWLKDTLGERVAEVKASDRLVDSPVLAINADKFMSPHMRRMMKAMKKDEAESPLKVNLKINPRHAVLSACMDFNPPHPRAASSSPNSSSTTP